MTLYYLDTQLPFLHEQTLNDVLHMVIHFCSLSFLDAS